MKHGRHLAFFFILLVSAGGTFVATYAWQSGPACDPAETQASCTPGQLCGWLCLGPEERGIVSGLEVTYRTDRAELEAAVAAQRDALAALFESGSATDAQILEQVEKVITANNALERRTAQFLLDIRPHLGAEQQKRLLCRFAEGVREGGRQGRARGWQRCGENAGDTNAASDLQPGCGHGRGCGKQPGSADPRP
jgi:hypothetical protein